MTKDDLPAVLKQKIVTTVSAKLRKDWCSAVAIIAKAEFEAQLQEEVKLNALIAESLGRVKV